MYGKVYLGDQMIFEHKQGSSLRYSVKESTFSNVIEISSAAMPIVCIKVKTLEHEEHSAFTKSN